MNSLEKKLKALNEISPDQFPTPLEDTPLTEKDIFLMSSLGWIEKHDRPDGGWWVNPTDNGMTHFLRKKQEAKKLRSDRLWHLFAGFCIGVSSTLFVENFSGILSFFLRLFSQNG